MQEAKQSIRQRIKSALAAIPGTLRDKKSRRIATMLYEASVWQKANVILLYLSFTTEAKTDEMVLQALTEKKIVAVPRVTGRNMVFHRIRSLEKGLEMNRLGIREPLPNLPVIEPGDILHYLVITPGLAFDREKNRLGRGGGYYDRFICKIRQGRKSTIAGVCFAEQVMDSVPVNPRDEKVDMIITDEGIIW